MSAGPSESSSSIKRGREEEDSTGEKKPKPEYKNPFDWTCPNCGDHCYASRSNCRHCNTARPESSKESALAAKNPGDWTCPNCGDHVFASRPSCRKCGTGKSNGMPAAQLGTSKFNTETRPGDWNCISCGDHNYASRYACRKCNAPRPEPGQMGYGGFGAGGAQQFGGQPAGFQTFQNTQAPVNYEPYGSSYGYGGSADGFAQYAAYDASYGASTDGHGGIKQITLPPVGTVDPALTAMGIGRPGDWLCPGCGEHCFASRGACRKCGGLKPGIGLPSNIPSTLNPSMTRPGDWVCPSCGDHSYATRTVCRKCNTPKPGSASAVAAAADTSFPKAVPDGMGGVVGGRPGDWMCPSCSNHCYASRSQCFKCKAAKPGY